MALDFSQSGLENALQSKAQQRNPANDGVPGNPAQGCGGCHPGYSVAVRPQRHVRFPAAT
jgi:hypothetical protein